jgi:hypothetical protein
MDIIETLIQEGTVRSRCFGKRRLIDRRDVDAYIDQVFAQEQEPPTWVAAAAERGRKTVERSRTDQGQAA